MPVRALIVVVAAGMLAGCRTPDSAPAEFRPNRDKSVEITPATADFVQQRALVGARPRLPAGRKGATTGLPEDDVITLPKFVVTEQGFVKFGFSVVTNTEVAAGGRIEWMQVGVVIPGSRADRQGLFTGLQILAIDGIVVTDLTRDAMLQVLFARRTDERLRLLVYSRALGPLPRFVTLDGHRAPLR